MPIAIVVLGLALVLLLLVWQLRSRHTPLPRPSDPAGMRSHVSFAAERYFPDGAEGGDLARAARGILERVSRGLTERGLAPGEVVEEAWGAFIEVGSGSDQLRVCAGYRGEGWLVYVTHGSGAIVDTPLARRLLEALHASLKAMPDIEQLRWHRAEDWAVGREEQAAGEPLGR
jgi:hypothetical protein